LNKKQNILLAFYGDDLTGSTDALEFISRAGAKAVLFLDPPTRKQLNAFPGLQAYGIAGLTRSLSPDKMEKVLLPAFNIMKASGAKHVHYKVCSTFDSSPQTGSIGRAIDCGAAVFQNKMIPVLGGMPALGRYCVFGNLFARMGIGSKGNIYRLDRHPSMSKHPVTPSTESDLRLHLSCQTKKKIGLIDVTQLDKEMTKWKDVEEKNEVVLLDALTDEHLSKIGEWLVKKQEGKKPLFSVGSSGIELALGSYWKRTSACKTEPSWKRANKAEPILVLSGSCSPVTKNQIAFALSNDFAEVPLQMVKKKGRSGEGFVVGADVNEIVTALRKKKSVIVHTNKIAGIEQSASAGLLGKALGCIGLEVCRQIKLKRIVIAGGDTSSYAGRAMEIEALEMTALFVSGAPLCKVYSKNKSIDGTEINLKGGQVGAEDYFVKMKIGKP
jgi:3-oxoisoapionate kinase